MYHLKIYFVSRYESDLGSTHDIECEKFTVQDGCVVVTNPAITRKRYVGSANSPNETTHTKGTRAYPLASIEFFDVLEN